MARNIKDLDPKVKLSFKKVFGKSIDEVKISAFTEEELRAYDKFWDRVSSEKTLMEGRYDEGKIAGEAEKALEIAKNMKAAGMALDVIQQMTGVSIEVIKGLES